MTRLRSRPLLADHPPPEVAVQLFGDSLPLAETYWYWLATAGVDRGLLGPREVDRLWERHLVNCAALVDFLPSQGPVVDLGSGAGLPGVVLALIRPDLDIVLVEPLQRRVSFLTEVVDDLSLTHVRVVRANAQEYGRTRPRAATAVVARAVAPLDRLAQWAAPLLAPGGSLLALKGATADDEVASAREGLTSHGLSVQAPREVYLGDSVTWVVRARRRGP